MQRGPVPGVQALFAAALAHHRAGRLAEAERLYQQLLNAAPRHADALHFKGLLAHQTGRPALALALMDEAIAQNGRVPTVHHNRGVVLSEAGRHREAADAYRQAITLNPQLVEAHHNLGVSLQRLSSLEEAASSYARVIALKPDFAEAHTNLGIIRCEQGRLQEAETLFERALSRNPRHAEAHNGFGNVRRLQSRFDEAVAAYERALECQPEFIEAHDNIGLLLLERGLPRDALRHFERALSERTDHAPALSHQGNALKELGDTAAAVVAYRRAIALAPDEPEARLGLAIATIPLIPASVAASGEVTGAFLGALGEVSHWSESHPGSLGPSVGRNLPFYLAYRPGDVGAALARYGDLMSAAAAMQWPEAAKISGTRRAAGRQIRLTVISGHVHRHPVWDVILRGLLAHLDRGQIRVTLYHTSSITDTETVWAAGQVDRFVQGPQSMRAWLEDIALDLPDVLFYPEVGMDATTWGLAALRLAPVQAAGWGHPVTTGLPTIDAYLSGELLEASGAEAHYRERLVKLPGTGVCTTPVSGPAQRWESPPRPADVVRFALCQQPIKFDPADDVLLARIARSSGPCEFWLVRPQKLDWTVDTLRERLAAAFRAEGLDPDRHLYITPWMPPDRFLGYLDDMDVYLDCPAFSGYTTAWQAVQRGLPIVTSEGPYLRQRLAAGLLRQMGSPQGIASTRDEYVAIAAAFAGEVRGDPPARTARRAALRRAAPQVDGQRDSVGAFERFLLESRVGFSGP